tara:strand:- start:1423 stop:2004 length:582 start_codon:yes stop_codon:yes gene_type:complete
MKDKEKKIKLEILGLSSGKSDSGSFALVLGENKGKRRLPIIIGIFEAQAIAMEIEKVVPNRPMTHDLFKHFSLKFDFKIKEIFISDIKEGVFYSKIVCFNSKKEIFIDSRPSDAIAIALRFKVDIFASEKVMSEAGIILDDDDPNKENIIDKSKSKSFKDMNIKELNKLLEKNISSENYEVAAEIRDEINKRN